MFNEKKRIQDELKKSVSDESTCQYVLKALPSNSGRSTIWDKMYFVHERDGEKRVMFNQDGKDYEFVACVDCKTVWSYISTSGTSTLKQHKCPGSATNRAIAGPMREYCTQGKPLTADKKRITLALADFCAQDLRPFNIVKGPGFKNMIQTVLDIAVKHNKRLLVDDLVCEPINVRRNATERASSGRAILQRILEEHLSTGMYVACTLDMWTDDINKVGNSKWHSIRELANLVNRFRSCQ